MLGTVLIVDDSALMRKIVLRALDAADLDFEEVLEAGDGKEALKLLKANTVALIMCDINMPVMNGMELLKAMREQNVAAGVPVLMVTTESSAEHVQEAVAVGASGYVRKPFTTNDIREKVLALLH
jgi:two-component system chemotaxis response regulator CheY